MNVVLYTYLVLLDTTAGLYMSNRNKEQFSAFLRRFFNYYNGIPLRRLGKVRA